MQLWIKLTFCFASIQCIAMTSHQNCEHYLWNVCYFYFLSLKKTLSQFETGITRDNTCYICWWWNKMSWAKAMTVKNRTSATNVTLHLLGQAAWWNIWKYTVEKNQINATNVIMHSLRQVIWGDIWKHTLVKSKTNDTSVTLHPPLRMVSTKSLQVYSATNKLSEDRSCTADIPSILTTN